MRACAYCGKETADYQYFCSWDCHVEQAKKDGGRVHTPNGLPIRCIGHDGLMLEDEHGDHPDYKFPVEVDYVGPVGPEDLEDYKMCCGEEGDEAKVRDFRGETHAFIYTDGSVVVTMYECCHAMWYLREGELGGGSLWKKKQWRLSEASCEAIRKFLLTRESK